jgi:transposase
MGLYVKFQQRNFKAPDVVAFLRALLFHIRGHVVLLWDNGKIHKGPEMDELRRRFPRLHVEWFPAYAPELNPVEKIWSDFKGHSANSLFLDRQDIRLSLHGSARRARRSQPKLRSFVLASELPSPPWAPSKA